MKKLFLALAAMLMMFGCEKDCNIPSNYVTPLFKFQAMYVTTRAISAEGNMDWLKKYPIPDEGEINDVLSYIASKPDGVEWPKNEGKEPLKKFYVQNVGGAHHMYSYYDSNGALHTDIDGTSGQEQMEIKEFDGTWSHLLNFNAGKCDNSATNNSVYCDNGFLDARTLSEYSSSTNPLYRLFFYNGNYYLGFDFCAIKNDGVVEADGCYDDWVVKIIPDEVLYDGNDDGGNDEGEPDFDDGLYHRSDTIDGVPVDTEFRWDDDAHTYIRIAIPIYKRTKYIIELPNIECLQDDTRIVSANDVTELTIDKVDKEYKFCDILIEKTGNKIILDNSHYQGIDGQYELKIPLTVSKPESVADFKKYILELLSDWKNLITYE